MVLYLFRRDVLLKVGLACTLLAPLVLIPYMGFDQYHNGTGVTAPLTQALLPRVSAQLPQNPAAMSILAALPSLVLYLLVERQFARAEMTGPLLPALETIRRGMEPQ